ncbi:MAG: hypothetical protein ABI563_17540 [Specibacter sp.]
MKILVAGIWAAMVAPFAIAAISGGPGAPWGHVAFHSGYTSAAAPAVVLLCRLRRSTHIKALQLLSPLLAGAQILFIIGQLGELLIIGLQHGPQPGHEALQDARHDVATLALTGPGLLGTAALLVALTWAVVATRRAEVGPAAVEWLRPTKNAAPAHRGRVPHFFQTSVRGRLF